MAPNATIYKAELQVSDMDRQYYASHALTIARHPSETAARVMVRLLAFVLHADERLAFGRGLSTDEDPDLWQKDYGGDIERWIDLGQPDEADIRKACAKARQVVVVNYSGASADIWWNKHETALRKLHNLTVLAIAPDDVAALETLLERSMRLTAMIQDGEVQLLGEQGSVALVPQTRMGGG